MVQQLTPASGGGWYGGTGYSYDPSGRRVMKNVNADPQGTLTGTGYGAGTWEFYFYGLNGRKMGTIDCGYATGHLQYCMLTGQNTYFAGQLIVENGGTVVTDRLGSVRANAYYDSGNIKYLPYGAEQTATTEGVTKFGTYTRDAAGQAEQRYYNAGMGRFWSPDPGGMKTAHPANATSWNRYAYLNGDPVNSSDPSGLDGVCGPNGTWMGEGCYNYSSQSSDINEAYNQYVTTLASTIGWVSGEDPVSILQAAAQNFSPPNTPCEQSVVTNTILTDAKNVGLNLSGYDLSGAVASIAGQTSGVLGSGTDSMTELIVNPSDPSTAQASFDALVASLGSSFTYAGYDPLHPGYQYSYRQNVGQYSMQISYNPTTYSLSIDIDPWNPQYGDLMSFLGHVDSVISNTLTGGDTNYQSVANALGIPVTPCGH